MNFLSFMIYTALISYASLRPTASSTIDNWDKVAHVVAYFIFALIGYRLVSSRRHYLYLCLGIMVYGVLMELGQSYMPGRMMSIHDVLANCVGVAIAVVFTRVAVSSKIS